MKFIKTSILAFFAAFLIAAPARAGGPHVRADITPHPVVQWDFAVKGTLPARLTMAGGVNGTYFDASGHHVSGSAPRFDHDLASGKALGPRIEMARTNVVLWNRDLTNAAWVKSGSMTAALDQVGLDAGANTASSLASGRTDQTACQSITLASSARAQTAYVKRITGTGEIDMTMNATNTAGAGATWTDITAKVGANFGRTNTISLTVTNPIVCFRVRTNGDKLAVDAVQNENGTFATTPILTTTAAVTRTAETDSIIGAGLTALGGRKGSVLVKLSMGIPAQDATLVQSGTGVDGANRAEWLISVSSGGLLGYVWDVNNSLDLNGSATPAGYGTTFGYSWRTGVPNVNSIVLSGSSPTRSRIVSEVKSPTVLPSSNLATAAGQNIVGWAEWDFSVVNAGWYRLTAPSTSNYVSMKFRVDLGNPITINNDWVWLTAGAHTLRSDSYYWTGYPNLGTIVLLKTLSSDGPGFAINAPNASPYVAGAEPSFLAGSAPNVTINVGGDAAGYNLSRTGDIVASVPVSASPTLTTVSVPLSQVPGDHTMTITRPGGIGLTQNFNYTIFPTAQVSHTFTKGALLQTIDMTTTAPDYSEGVNSVVTTAAGTYRQTNAYGWLEWIGTAPGARDPAKPPGWFAYTLTLSDLVGPFIMELDYPDDAVRIQVSTLRMTAPAPFAYPPSFSLETGTLWPISNTMQTRDLIFWASQLNPRVTVENNHDGNMAAASQIRIYRAVEAETSVSAPPTGFRDFVYWHEEGTDFDFMVNSTWNQQTIYNYIDRMLTEVQFFGGTIFMPSVSVYSAQLWPSSVLGAFARPTDSDYLLAMLLDAQRLGLKIIVQVNARADEILWTMPSPVTDHLLVSRSGGRQYLDLSGFISVRPVLLNPLDYYVQTWYISLIGEIADKYAAYYPTFAGIDLRVMMFGNSGLTNLISLDYGYDYATFNQFCIDTGLTCSAGLTVAGTDDTITAPQRYSFIIPAHQAAWVAWRNGKMRDFYAAILARVHAANANLAVYESINSVGNDYLAQPTLALMLNAGIDPALLTAAGISMVQTGGKYGQRVNAPPSWSQDALTYNQTASNFSGFSSMLMYMDYVESDGSQFITSAQLGINGNDPPFSSSASNPPGRLYLERFALMLGQTDAQQLGDGGNGIVFPPFAMREFQQQYKLIKKVAFTNVHAGPSAPPFPAQSFALWQNGTQFYVVNMTNASVDVTLTVSGSPTISRADGSGNLSGLVIALQPYQLLVFNSTVSNTVTGAS